MNTWTRVSAIVVAVLGVACLVFGIIFLDTSQLRRARNR